MPFQGSSVSMMIFRRVVLPAPFSPNPRLPRPLVLLIVIRIPSSTSRQYAPCSTSFPAPGPTSCRHWARCSVSC